MRLAQNLLNHNAFLLLTSAILLTTFFSCEKDDKDPHIKTTSITALSASKFEASAKITEKGDYKIIDHGFVYYLGSIYNENSIQTQNKVSLGSTISDNEYSSVISIGEEMNISSNNKFFVRSYITNSKGTVYGNALSKDILMLQVYNVTPSSAKVGDTITINGQNFDPSITGNKVSFNTINATIVSATSTSIKAIVPLGISTSYYESYVTLKVSSGGQYKELYNSFKLAASPTGFYPTTGNWNTTINITGSNLSTSTVYFNDIPISYYSSSSNSISVSVPSSINTKKFKIYLSSGGIKTEVPGGYFTMANLSINPLTQTKYLPGSTLTFTGTNYNPNYGYNKLLLGTTSIVSNGYSSLQFTLPQNLAKGEYTAKITNNIDTVELSNKIIIIEPTITNISPTSGYPNTSITIEGDNFINNLNAYVYFGSQYANTSTSSSTSKIIVNAPWIAPGEYPISVKFDNYTVQTSFKFTIVEPKITSITPSTGAAGTSVVIAGEGFEASNYFYVYFGNLNATILSTTNSQINVKVPTGVTSGVWLVKVYINNYQLTSTLNFTVP